MLLLAGCREPTQITVEITTDAKCPDLDEVQITVGDLDQLAMGIVDATTKACSDTGRIGDLVVVPGGSQSASVGIQIGVGFANSTQACVESRFEGSCIVARRGLNFIPHQPIVLPVELEVACIDVPCDISETCRNGRCVSAVLSDPLECTDPAGCSTDGTGGGTGGLGTTGTDASTTGGGTGAMGGSGGTTNTGGSVGSGGSMDVSSGGSSGGSGGTSGGTPSGGSGASGGTGASSGSSGGSSSGGSSSGGSSSGGSSSGGSSSGGGNGSGGAGSGGTGGGSICGNDALDDGEQCDDGNLVDRDGCSASCTEEFLMVTDFGAGAVRVHSWQDGTLRYTLADEANAGAGFLPAFAEQAPSGRVFVADMNAGKVLRFESDGSFVDATVISNLHDLAFAGSDLLVAADQGGVARYDSDTFAPLSDFSTALAWGLQGIDERWALVADANFGDVSLVDTTDNVSPQVVYSGGTAYNVTRAADGRVYVCDWFNDEVQELVPTTASSAEDPLGLPLGTGRVVIVPYPYTMYPLNNGMWLVASDNGLFAYDPDLDQRQSELSATDHRSIAPFAP